MDPITAYAMTLMLEGVTQVGTGAEAGKVFGARPIAGKTGTTNDYRSAWFVGYTPDLVVGAFVGFDDNRSLGDKETGAKAAIPIWIDFMQDALKDQPATDFTAPPDVKMAWAHGHKEAFRPGTEPKPPPPKAPRIRSPLAIVPPTPYGQAFPNGRPARRRRPAEAAAQGRPGACTDQPGAEPLLKPFAPLSCLAQFGGVSDARIFWRLVAAAMALPAGRARAHDLNDAVPYGVVRIDEATVASR